MNMQSDDKSAGARERGAIQKGQTGDKVPGFDPAAAPMETDSEAGGQASTVTQHPPPHSSKPNDANASSTASGMRELQNDMKPRSDDKLRRESHPYLVWLLLIVGLVLIAYFAVTRLFE